MLDNAVSLTDNALMQPPLPVKIPQDYAEVLGVHPTEISHVNAGRRTLSWPRCLILLEHARSDPRLAGLDILELRPEIEDRSPFLVDLIQQWFHKTNTRG